MSVPDGNPWDWISAGMWQHRNSQALISSWDELWFSKGWIRRGYLDRVELPGLEWARKEGARCGDPLMGILFPAKWLFQLYWECWEEGNGAEASSSAPFPTAAPAPCPWNSVILTFCFLPTCCHFPEGQNSQPAPGQGRKAQMLAFQLGILGLETAPCSYPSSRCGS